MRDQRKFILPSLGRRTPGPSDNKGQTQRDTSATCNISHQTSFEDAWLGKYAMHSKDTNV